MVLCTGHSAETSGSQKVIPRIPILRRNKSKLKDFILHSLLKPLNLLFMMNSRYDEPEIVIEFRTI